MFYYLLFCNSWWIIGFFPFLRPLIYTRRYSGKSLSISTYSSLNFLIRASPVELDWFWKKKIIFSFCSILSFVFVSSSFLEFWDFMGISVCGDWILDICDWNCWIFVLLHDCKFPILFFQLNFCVFFFGNLFSRFDFYGSEEWNPGGAEAQSGLHFCILALISENFSGMDQFRIFRVCVCSGTNFTFVVLTYMGNRVIYGVPVLVCCLYIWFLLYELLILISSLNDVEFGTFTCGFCC